VRHLPLERRPEALVGNEFAHGVRTEPARPWGEDTLDRHRAQLVHERRGSHQQAAGRGRQERIDEDQPSDLQVRDSAITGSRTPAPLWPTRTIGSCTWLVAARIASST
jgi:hypothetical protein